MKNSLKSKFNKKEVIATEKLNSLKGGSNVLNTMHQGAMNSVRNIRA